MQRQRGFTLLEIMVVIVILGILASLVAVSYTHLVVSSFGRTPAPLPTPWFWRNASPESNGPPPRTASRRRSDVYKRQGG